MRARILGRIKPIALGQSILLSLTSTPVTAEAPVIAVYVFGGQDPTTGFVDNEVRDSVRDLTGALSGKGGIRVVSSEAAADITFEVLHRQKEEGASFSARVAGQRADASASNRYIVNGRLLAGEYSRDFTGTDINFWKRASGDLAKQISKWIEQNRAQLLARRSTHALAPSPHTSEQVHPVQPPPSRLALIKSGMTVREVESILGKPDWHAAFEDTLRWTYADVTVIFEGERVKRAFASPR